MRAISGTVLLALSAAIPAIAQGNAQGQQVLSKGEVARIVDEYLAARDSMAPSGLDAALERISFYGDLRLRQEESFRLEGAPDRHRSRMRVRAGLTYELDPGLSFGARLVTGNRRDPRSPHLTFGDGFDGLEVSLDRAFVDWRPSGLEGLWLKAGKFAHPMHRNPIYGELVWDADIQPEGVAAGYSTRDRLGFDTLSFNVGQYALIEQSIGSDSWASFAELSATRLVADAVTAKLATSFTGIWRATPDGSTTLLDDNRGNLVLDIDGDGDPDRFASGFGVLDTILELHLERPGAPLVFSFEWLKNLRAASSNGQGGQGDQGYAAGLAWGRAAKAGDWRFYYQYASIEREAIFSPLTQDDFLFATGHQSHVAGIMRQLTDSAGLHLWGLVSQAEDGSSSDHDWRLRLDLNLKF